MKASKYGLILLAFPTTKTRLQAHVTQVILLTAVSSCYHRFCERHHKTVGITVFPETALQNTYFIHFIYLYILPSYFRFCYAHLIYSSSPIVLMSICKALSLSVITWSTCICPKYHLSKRFPSLMLSYHISIISGRW